MWGLHLEIFWPIFKLAAQPLCLPRASNELFEWFARSINFFYYYLVLLCSEYGVQSAAEAAVPGALPAGTSQPGSGRGPDPRRVRISDGGESQPTATCSHSPYSPYSRTWQFSSQHSSLTVRCRNLHLHRFFSILSVFFFPTSFATVFVISPFFLYPFSDSSRISRCCTCLLRFFHYCGVN